MQNQKAEALIRAIDIPSNKNEKWRYSDLKLLTECQKNISSHQLEKTEHGDKLTLKEEHHHIVFINGELNTKLSNFPQCITINHRDSVDLKNDFDEQFEVLHAYKNTDRNIEINISLELTQPIEITHLVTNKHFAQSCRFNISQNAKIIENFIGEGCLFLNYVNNFLINKNVDICHIKHTKNLSNFIYSSQVNCENNAQYSHYTSNSKLCSYRENILCNLKEKSVAEIFGINYGKEEEKYDTLIEMRHLEDNTKSTQHYNCAFSDNSHGSFSSCVTIPKNIQNAHSKQLNHNILISKKAKAFSIPKLDIKSQNVSCSHGATVGKLDIDAKNYLKSRGLEEEKAVELILNSFLCSVFSNKDLNQAEYTKLTTYK